MTKIIVTKVLCLLTFLILATIGYSQIPCNSYESNRLIIEIDEGPLGPNEIGGTAAFTNYGGVIVDEIFGETYTIYLVEFNLPNTYFNSIEDALSFYECGGGIDPSGISNTIIKVKKVDLNYHINNNPDHSTGSNYNYPSYGLLGSCEEEPLFQGLTNNNSNPLIASSPPVRLAFVDSGHLPGTPYDHHVLMDEGYDFANNDAIPDGPDPHGTYVSSITAGMAFNTMSHINFVPVQILDESGTCDLFTFYKGFNYAAEVADIINLSVGTILCEGDMCTVVFDDMLLEAEDNNKLVVAASGNDGVSIDYQYDNQSYYHIPGSCQGDNLIVVGSASCFDNVSYFSNIGQNNVDLLAPGEGIIVYPNVLATGTSFSTPQVTAVAAVMTLNSPVPDFSTIKCSILENVTNQGWATSCLTGGSLNYNNLSISCNAPIPFYVSPPNKSKAQNLNSKIKLSRPNGIGNTLAIQSDSPQNALVHFFDLSGKIIKVESFPLSSGTNNYRFDFAEFTALPTGLYFISVHTENNGVSTYKWIKQ